MKNKKGQFGVQEFVELIIGVAIAAMFITAWYGLGTGETTAKKRAAIESSLTINALNAISENAQIEYPGNTTQLTITLDDQKTTIKHQPKNQEYFHSNMLKMKTKTLSNPEKIYFFKNGKNIGISKNKIELNKRYCDKNIRKGNTKIKVENKELRNKIKQRIGYKCNEEKKTCARSERTLNNADTYIKIKNTAEEGIQIRYSYQSSSSKKLACNIINKIKEDTSKNWFLPTKDQELKYSQAENKILINSGFKNEKTLQLLQEILI